MKKLLFLFIFIAVTNAEAQDTIIPVSNRVKERNFIYGQIGGQTIISAHHEYAIIAKRTFYLNTNIGFGLNQTEDAETGENAIYGLHSGVTMLFGVRPTYIELGVIPCTYFYRGTTFTNLNSWIGFRFLNRGFMFGVGYSPQIYTNYGNPNKHFLNSWIGLKSGLNF